MKNLIRIAGTFPSNKWKVKYTVSPRNPINIAIRLFQNLKLYIITSILPNSSRCLILTTLKLRHRSPKKSNASSKLRETAETDFIALFKEFQFILREK